MRFVRVFATIVLALLIHMGAGSDAAAQPNLTECVPQPAPHDAPSTSGGFSNADSDATSGGVTSAILNAELCTIDDLDPNQPPDTDYRGPAAEGVVATVSDASEPDDNCVDYFTPYSADPEVSYSPYCVKWRVCGGERVDDIVSGEIAGAESTGQYRNYLDQFVGIFDGAIDGVATDAADVSNVDTSSVSDFLLTQGLGDQPGDDLLPVFSWCADYAQVDGARVFDPVDLASVSFGWDLTYDDVYDIPAATDSLYTLLQARLDLYKPEIGLVPSAEVGFTLVKWPTWMYLQNPSEDITLFATNSTDTLRIDLRAHLVGVDWYFGDELLVTCAAEDMLPYTEQLDPIDDLPDCHHWFNELDCQDLTATTRFKIEQMVRTRPSASNHEYPTTGWSDFLDTPTEIALASTVDDYEVHEFRSMNAVAGLTTEEVLARARAVGTIPERGDTCDSLAK